MTISTADLKTVIIIARVPTYMSGADNRSAPNDPGASVPNWSSGDYNPGVLDPGEPCGTATNPAYGELAADFLLNTSVVACPRTDFPSICFDFYISRCRLLLGAGDCRDEDPYAPKELSRAQVIVPIYDTDAPKAVTWVSASCWVGGTVCNPALKEPYNQSQIQHFGSTGDSIAVKVKLTNSITNAIPPIDFSGLVVRNPDGSISIAVNRDAFPSLTVVKSQWGENTVLVQRDETSFRALLSWSGMTDSFVACYPQPTN